MRQRIGVNFYPKKLTVASKLCTNMYNCELACFDNLSNFYKPIRFTCNQPQKKILDNTINIRFVFFDMEMPWLVF